MTSILQSSKPQHRSIPARAHTLKLSVSHVMMRNMIATAQICPLRSSMAVQGVRRMGICTRSEFEIKSERDNAVTEGYIAEREPETSKRRRSNVEKFGKARRGVFTQKIKQLNERSS